MLSAQIVFKMNTQIDFRTLPANVPVLCIPRVYPNISEARIRRIFDELDMGVLERIDIVPKGNVVSSKHNANPGSDKGDKFNRVFVHFRRWNDSENANIARERLLNGKEIKLIYDEPWFWKISAYREYERKPSASQTQSAAPRRATLQFDSDEERRSSQKPVSKEPRHNEDRPRYDDRPRYQPRHRNDSRERPRRRDDYRRPERHEEKPRHEEPSSTPPSSPQRRRDDSRERPHAKAKSVSELPKIDYGDAPLPPMKKRIYGENMKKPLKIEDDEEEGEIVSDNTEKNA